MVGQEIQEMLDTTLRIAIAYVVGRRIDVDQPGADDSLIHLRVGTCVTD